MSDRCPETAAAARVTVASSATSRSTGSSVATGTGDSAADSAADSATNATTAVRAPAFRPVVIGAMPCAAVMIDSSTSSSASAASSATKKCACCHRLLPVGDYSGAQLKAKGKRHCKVCVAGLQKIQPESKQSGAVADGAAHPRWQVKAVSELMSSPLESDQLAALDGLVSGLRGLSESNNGAVNVSWKTKVVVGVLHAAREAQTERISALALECISLMVRRPTLLAQLVDAGAIPILVDLLRLRAPPLSAKGTVCTVHAVQAIAHESRVNCDALLAAGVLDDLLPLVRLDIPADLCDNLFPALSFLMQLRPAAEMGAAVTRIGTVLMDAFRRDLSVAA